MNDSLRAGDCKVITSNCNMNVIRSLVKWLGL